MKGLYLGSVCSEHPNLGGVRRNGECLECSRIRVREYSAKNKEAALRRVYEWRKANPEKYSALGKRHRQKHANKIKTRIAKWCKDNLHKKAANESKRRANKLGQTPTLSTSELESIKAIYAKAARLTKETGYQWHVDHDMPLARGGLHHPDNLQVIPAKMNLSKGARFNSTLEYMVS